MIQIYKIIRISLCILVVMCIPITYFYSIEEDINLSIEKNAIDLCIPIIENDVICQQNNITQIITTYNNKLSTKDIIKITEAFYVASKTYTIPIDIILSVSISESNFNPNVISKEGARGIMQVMPRTLHLIKKKGKIKYKDPIVENIYVGSYYLNYLYDITKIKFPNSEDKDIWKLVFMHYNYGDAAVDKYIKNKLPKSVIIYARRIMENSEKINKIIKQGC